MSTRAATWSATTALAGSRVRTDLATNAPATNRPVGRPCTATGTWIPTIVLADVAFVDSKHGRRPEEEASQH